MTASLLPPDRLPTAPPAGASVGSVVAEIAAPPSSRAFGRSLPRARGRDRAILALATLGLVTTAALLQARGIGHVMAAELVATPEAGLAVPHAVVPSTVAPADGAEHRSALRSYGALGVPAAVVAEAIDWPGEAEGPIDLYAAPRCADIELAGLAAFADPRASLATLRLSPPPPTTPEGVGEPPPTSITLAVGQGEAVLEGRVLFIGQDRVWIERPPRPSRQGVRVCQAPLAPAPAAPPR
jgi:hypothetical protein